MSENQNNRNTRPISLHPLSVEDALRKAMRTPAPKADTMKVPSKPKKSKRATGGSHPRLGGPLRG